MPKQICLGMWGDCWKFLLPFSFGSELSDFCENIFGFEKLKGYDTGRIYAYLSERYLSFWFKKYTKYKEQPWIFLDY